MPSTETAGRSRSGAGFLFLLGLGLVALGAGFAFAPHFSWQVTKIARQANELGLQNGMLVVGGLVVLAVGISARGSRSTPSVDPRPEIESLQSEMQLFNEQLTNKIAQLRTALLQVQEGVSAVASQQQNQLQNQTEKPAGGDHSQDALFRLAASLDKLHAHMDERVHAVDLQLRSGFEALLSASQDVRRHLEVGGIGSGAQGTYASHPPQYPAHAPHAPHASAHQQPAGPAARQQQPQSGIDFFETMQKLEAIAGGDSAGPANPQAPHAHGHQPQPPFPSQGNVDSLDALLPEEYRDRY